ncbi:MAG: hypothetical protein AAFZ18_07490 [Myxococcota bacterium]
MRIQARILAADLDTLPRTKLEDCAEDLHGCADVLFVYDGEIDDFLREVDCEAVVGTWAGATSGTFAKVGLEHARYETDAQSARALDLWPARRSAEHLLEVAEGLRRYARLVIAAEARFERAAVLR